MDPAARGHAAKVKRFLHMLSVAIPCSEAGGLMRGVAQHPAHLLGVQVGCATCRCCRAKKGRNTVRAPVTLGLKALTAQGHGKAWTDVVAKRGGAQKMRSANAKPLACCQCS